MPIGLSAPDWQAEKGDWPHAAHSDFLKVGRHRWHMQRLGSGPVILLLHGTAASTHSFAALAPLLAESFEVVMIDLPGHGFTTSPTFWEAAPETIARDLAALLKAEGIEPRAVGGHSAGAVAGIELASILEPAPALFVSINGAFRPFEGISKFIAPALAKATYYNPLPAYAFAQAAKRTDRVRNLIEQTGSLLPERNIELYRRLLRYPGHVSGALHLMADWHHEGIERRVRNLKPDALLITGSRDRAVPPTESQRLMDMLPSGRYEEIEETGHLTHEEQPGRVATLIVDAAKRAGVA